MSLKMTVFAIFVGVLGGLPQASATDIVARCNYDFDVSPGIYDRGSVAVTRNATGYRMQFIQDDEATGFDKVKPSTATGDWARDMIKKDVGFSKYIYQAHIDPTLIVKVDAYVAPVVEGGDDPQARFFVFSGAGARFLGGFGIFGKRPFICDWAER